jgi:hypothetical protein
MRKLIIGSGASPIKIALTEEEYNKCNEFGIKMYQRPWHAQLAASKRVSPEKLRDDYINGVLFETGVKKFVNDNLKMNCPPVNLEIRTQDQAIEINYEADFFLSDGYNIHVKSSRRKSDPSFIFEKNDIAYYDPGEYDWIIGGVLCDWGADLSVVKIYSVYSLQKAKSLNLFKDLDNQNPKKQALDAFDLVA